MPLYNPPASSSGGGALTATAVKTGNYTAVASDKVLCNASGGSFTVTLPGSPSDGNRVGVFATHAPGANAVTISGTITGATHDSKLYIIGDYLEFQYSSAMSGWLTIKETLTPHTAKVTLSAAITTNTAATAKKVTYDTEVYDVGGCYDPATNHRFVVRRPGKYHAHVQCRPNSNLTTNKYYQLQVRVNGASTATMRFMCTHIGTTMAALNACDLLSLVATDYIEGFFVAEDANMGVGASTDDTFIVITEVR